jgi:C4-dicarboxylate transporter, DctM subunit
MDAKSLPEMEEKAEAPTIYAKLLSRIESVGVVLSAVFIVITMLLTTLDVLLRYAFNHPITGVYELESMMLAAIAYLGLSYIQSKRSHIAMDALSIKVHGPGKLVLFLLNDIIFLSVGVLFTWQMGVSTWNAWQIGDIYPGSAIHFPIWPVYLVITLGIGLTSLRLIEGLINNRLWHKHPGFSRAWSIAGVLITAVFMAVVVIVIILSHKMAFSPTMVGYVSIALFFILLLAGTPVAPSMAMIGIFGFWMLLGTKSALNMAGTVPFSSADHYDMTVLPLFIIMGSFGSLAGFAKAAFDAARRWVGRIPGGIVQATVVGATAFAAANGSSIASCAVLAKVTIPEMLKQGVHKGVAVGVVASAATLAIMIPPSGQFVVYGMITGTSIGKLLIAGIIPGLIGAAIIMLTIAIRIKFNPRVVPPNPEHYSWKDRFISIPQAWGILVIAVVVMGGIYTGIATPTEAGAVGAFVAFVTLVATKKAKWSQIRGALFEAGGISSSVLFILIGGMTFGYMISVSQLPQNLANWVVGLQVQPMLILISIIIVYIILGCFVDTLSTMIITLPIVFPIILGLGFDPIWFGVLMVQNAEIGAITPPFGMNLFVLKSMLPDYTLSEIFRGVAWFVAPLAVTMAIYIAFPQVSLWLPGLMVK